MKAEDLVNEYQAEYIRELARDDYKSNKEAKKKGKKANYQIIQSLLILAALLLFYNALRSAFS